jgi:hypothetical protein
MLRLISVIDVAELEAPVSLTRFATISGLSETGPHELNSNIAIPSAISRLFRKAKTMITP